ncbi:hypothetical protein GOP47_0004927 [Adiantum capillus-veneris]|uniref:Uncharacterized protein n=1 Tax=Adiantum capillus-veneris TaxID=13818 RepID=A0A9D4ZKX0_ADICA|nr:hypothetical protein GOP47_0004927 [Adiantum capillus-veneris]
MLQSSAMIQDLTTVLLVFQTRDEPGVLIVQCILLYNNPMNPTKCAMSSLVVRDGGDSCAAAYYDALHL